MLNIEKTTYGNKRIKRSEFVAQRFATLLDQKKVLDVGCFEAPLRKILVNSDYTGVDFVGNPDIEINLQETTRLPFDDNSFDTVFCIDVLEHLVRPDLVLYRLRSYLSYNGYFIASIPNIARLEHRLKLFFGNFNYSSYGALSKGHLRFFTLKTASELIESSGYKIKKIEPTGLGSIIRVFPNLLAFQFLFMAVRK